MRFAIIIAFLLMIVGFLILQYQILGLHSTNRKERCSTTIAQGGVIKKASDYELYTCLSRD